MKKESMVGRRLYAWIIDTLILFVLVFMFDGLVSVPVFNSCTDIKEISESYISHSKEYESIQDEYQIYIYDQDNNRIYNENISQETKNAFLEDERILVLNEILVKEQNNILGNFVLRISISIFIGSAIIYLLLPMVLKNGMTIGKTVAKIYVVNDEGEKARWYQLLLRYILSIVMNVYMAIISLGIVPLINLLVAISQKENKAVPDLICKTIVIDGKLPIDLIKKDF